MKHLLALAILVITAFSGITPAAALPPVPVPYRTTTHFRFFGDSEVVPILDRLAGIAEERFDRMCASIGACDRVTRPIDIWVAEDAETFAAGFPEGNPMSEWAAGVTFLEQQRVILRAHGSAMLTLMETFDHELAHVLAHTYTQGDGASVPRWFHEGLAIWQAGEAVLQRMQTAMEAASSGHLLTYEELTKSYPNQGKRVEIAYAQSALFVKRMVHEKGPAAVIQILQDTGLGIPFEAAFTTRLGTTPEALFDDLDAALEQSSSPFLFLHDGNFLWGLMTVLFVAVAYWRLRDRRRQMERIADTEEERIVAEDLALLAERLRATAAPHPIEVDEEGQQLLH